ncbi:hypothetical protein GOBAR_DD03201 [Gossypium barbadense]|nr:hypothetical protein GOBAR_DD03201 [Gossypium barbadense]
MSHLPSYCRNRLQPTLSLPTSTEGAGEPNLYPLPISAFHPSSTRQCQISGRPESVISASEFFTPAVLHRSPLRFPHYRLFEIFVEQKHSDILSWLLQFNIHIMSSKMTA